MRREGTPSSDRMSPGFVDSRLLRGRVFTLAKFAVFPSYFFLLVSPIYVGKTGLASSLGVPPSEAGLGSVFPRNARTVRIWGTGLGGVETCPEV